MDLARIKQLFRLLDDPTERVRFLVDLGESLRPFPNDLRTDANLVSGCMSRVWLHVHVVPDRGTVAIEADSDSLLVRGLAALMVAAFDGRSPADAASVDFESLFEELGLQAHLSPQRRNGLAGMLQRIRDEVELHVAESTSPDH